MVAQPTATPSSWETSTDDYYAGYPVLRVGSTGSDVSDMQTRLQELGYYTGEIDGRFAGGTQAAVEAFQTANGLTADGIAGRQTQDLLYSTSAVPKTITATDDQDGYALLKEGSYGTEERKLQARLTELGYYAGGVDGGVRRGDGGCGQGRSSARTTCPRRTGGGRGATQQQAATATRPRRTAGP